MPRADHSYTKRETGRVDAGQVNRSSYYLDVAADQRRMREAVREAEAARQPRIKARKR